MTNFPFRDDCPDLSYQCYPHTDCCRGAYIEILAPTRARTIGILVSTGPASDQGHVSHRRELTWTATLPNEVSLLVIAVRLQTSSGPQPPPDSSCRIQNSHHVRRRSYVRPERIGTLMTASSGTHSSSLRSLCSTISPDKNSQATRCFSDGNLRTRSATPSRLYTEMLTREGVARSAPSLRPGEDSLPMA